MQRIKSQIELFSSFLFLFSGRGYFPFQRFDYENYLTILLHTIIWWWGMSVLYHIQAHTSMPSGYGLIGMSGLLESRIHKKFMFNSPLLFCVLDFLLNLCNQILVVCHVLVNLLFWGLLILFFALASLGRFCFDLAYLFVCPMFFLLALESMFLISSL